jgi:hypothetical protein
MDLIVVLYLVLLLGHSMGFILGSAIRGEYRIIFDKIPETSLRVSELLGTNLWLIV